MSNTPDTPRPAPVSRRPFRGDTYFLQWVRLPLLAALSLVAAAAMQKPFVASSGEKVAHASGPTAAPPENSDQDVPAQGNEAEGEVLIIGEQTQVIAMPHDDLVGSGVSATLLQDIDPVEAAESLGATVRFLQVAVSGSLRQLSQTASQAGYPLRQMRNRWVTPWLDPGEIPAGQPGGRDVPFVRSGAAGAEGGTGQGAGPRQPDATVEGRPSIAPDTLTLANPSSNGGAIRFVLEGQVVALEPGQARTFPAGVRVVQFHRGGEFGAARHEVSQGIYAFTVASEGWRLVEQNSLPTDVDLPAGP